MAVCILSDIRNINVQQFVNSPISGTCARLYCFVERFKHTPSSFIFRLLYFIVFGSLTQSLMPNGFGDLVLELFLQENDFQIQQTSMLVIWLLYDYSDEIAEKVRDFKLIQLLKLNCAYKFPQ
jgi:hypothetical protein